MTKMPSTHPIKKHAAMSTPALNENRWERLDAAWAVFKRTKKVSDWVQVQIEASRLDLDVSREFYAR
jgi:hypothetical protein